jgi:hypothetical protein
MTRAASTLATSGTRTLQRLAFAANTPWRVGCNRTLEEHVAAMLNGARLPTRFWGEALYTYSRLLNMIPSAAIPAGTTPFEMANKRKPDYSTLRVFGCCAWAHVRRKKRRSLEPHAKPCVFLGIPDNFKGWKLWDPSAQGGRGGVIMSRDVIWNESEFPGLSKEAHDPIPVHFGRTDVDKPLPDAPRFEEIDDCDESEGAQPLPALIDEEDGLPPPDVEAPLPPLPPLPDESDDSDFENDAAPSTKTSSSLSSSSAASPPHTPPRSTMGTPVPSAPRLAQRQAAPRLPMLPAPDLLRRSGRQTAGVPPNPNYTATQYLQQGRPEPRRVATYKESRSRSTSAVPTSAPASRQSTPALLEPLDLPNVEEEADPATPGPSQAPESPIVEENSDEFDFLSGPHAASLVRRWQGERALLAQGIESIYGEEEELLTLRQALDHAFVASWEPSEPKTFREAMQRPDADLWYQAAVKEMEAHIENGTWELVKLPPSRKAIGSRWVFKVKCNADGSIERYKACVVAKGFSQRPGVDFDETFAPTTKWAALRVIFALAALEDWELESIDISNAYLNGELKDVEVCMRQPEGFAEKDDAWVARLLKGLYGLKQGGREWFKRHEEVLSQLSFTRIRSDGSIFIWAKDGVQVICPVFVDDITFASKSKAKIAELKAAIAKHFKLRDLGPTTFQLGVEIIRDCKARTLHLSQHRYCLDLLERYGFTDCSPVSTPLDPSVRLSTAQAPQTPEESAFMRTVPYVSAVGALMYLAIAMRPDIAFAVGVLCRSMANPGPEHWKAVKHLFCYLHGTCNFCLTYKPDPSAPYPFHAYSNTDHGANLDNGRSTSAYDVKIGSGAVSWMCLASSPLSLSRLRRLSSSPPPLPARRLFGCASCLVIKSGYLSDLGDQQK